MSEEEFWKKISLKDDLLDYEDYLSKYPNGEYYAEAKKKIKIIRFKKNKKPREEVIPKTINNETADWQSVLQHNTAEMYRKYLVKYPQGQYKNLAYDRIELFEAGETPEVAENKPVVQERKSLTVRRKKVMTTTFFVMALAIAAIVAEYFLDLF
jgi:hypothetical protein